MNREFVALALVCGILGLGCEHPLGEVRGPSGEAMHRAICGPISICYAHASRRCGESGYRVVDVAVDADDSREMLYSCRGE